MSTAAAVRSKIPLISGYSAYRVDSIKRLAEKIGNNEEKLQNAKKGLNVADLKVESCQHLFDIDGVSLPEFDSLIAKVTPNQYLTPLRFDLSATQIAGLAAEIIYYNKKIEDEVAAAEKKTFATVLLPLQRAYQQTAPLRSSCDFLSHCSTSKEIRDASSAAEQELDAADVESSLNEAVFQSVLEYSKTEEAKQLTGERKLLLERVLRSFRRSGLMLEPAKRERVKAIQKTLSELGIKFSKNLAELDQTFEFEPAELEGVPESLLSTLKKTEDGKKLIVRLQYSHYFPIMDRCRVVNTRKILEKAFTSRCIDTNTEILETMMQLRTEKAQLLGYKNHAEYILEIRMAKKPSAVQTFLRDLSEKLNPLVEKEMQYLLALKEAECKERGEEFDGRINAYDFRYYTRLAEEKQFKVDGEVVRQYFPLEHVTNAMLELYQKLLSLKFVEHTDANTKAPENCWFTGEEEKTADKKPSLPKGVRAFSVYDSRTNEFKGIFFLDLFPRPGKYTHAAVFPIVPGCAIFKADGTQTEQRQFPVCAMLCNFTEPSADRPSLLSHDEVTTFFHEFGHVMHGICSKTLFPQFHGTAVQRDFVEAPSQMLENWCYTQEALNVLSSHYQRKGEALPKDLLEAIVAARNANVGLLTKRQIIFGLFDQLCHSNEDPSIRLDTAKLFAEVSEKTWPIPQTPGTNFAASFGHLAGGYDASYYGYLWAEVFSADMFEKFKATSVLSPEAGLEYREKILQPGGSIEADILLKDFLGREVSMEPFLKLKGLK